MDVIMILSPGEQIIQRFTKENRSEWFKIFDPLCFRNGFRSENEKIGAFISCLDGLIFLNVQPLLHGQHTFDDVKFS